MGPWRMNATLSKACRGFALFLEGGHFPLSDGDHGFTPQLENKMRTKGSLPEPLSRDYRGDIVEGADLLSN